MTQSLSICASRRARRLQSAFGIQRSSIKQMAIYPDEEAVYASTHVIDAGQIELKIACPHTVDNVKPLREVAGTPIQQAFLGTCTNGRLEDIAAAAEIIKGKRVASGTRLLVIPASAEVYVDALTGRLRADPARGGRRVWHAGLRAVHGQSHGYARRRAKCASRRRIATSRVAWASRTPRSIWRARPSWRRAPISGVISDPREIE